MAQINRCICSINYYLLEKIVLTQLVNRSIVNNFRNTCARCVNDSDENRKKYKELHLSQHKAPLYLDQIEKITILSLTRDLRSNDGNLYKRSSHSGEGGTLKFRWLQFSFPLPSLAKISCRDSSLEIPIYAISCVISFSYALQFYYN